MARLPQNLAQHPFTYEEAIHKGLNQYTLAKLMSEGVIERVAKGVYIPSNYDDTNPESQFHLATLQCGTPSCICLLSALDFYHVTDQIPHKIWVMVPHIKRVRNKKLQLIRTRNPYWGRGIDKTNNYWITTPARTLVECLLYKNRLGSDVVLNALKRALQDKKVKLQDILRIANQMGVKKRIYPYIETLAS